MSAKLGSQVLCCAHLAEIGARFHCDVGCCAQCDVAGAGTPPRITIDAPVSFAPGVKVTTSLLPTWRSDPPNEPGWYWLKQDGYDAEPVELTHGGYVLFSGRLSRFRPSDLNASARWWPVPITPPAPPEKS